MTQKQLEADTSDASAQDYQALAYEGWKEATIAWSVCVSIYEKFAKGKDPFFKTRHADFTKAETHCRATLYAINSPGRAVARRLKGKHYRARVQETHQRLRNSGLAPPEPEQEES